MRDVRLTQPSLKLLALFLREGRRPLAGSDIYKMISLKSGTMYPILLRLESAGWLESEWEKLDPSEAGRPRKRMYRLTSIGRQKAKSALGELHG